MEDENVSDTTGLPLGGHLQYMVRNGHRDVDPGDIDAVAERHSVVHLVHQQFTRPGLQQVHSDDASADGFGRCYGKFMNLGCDRTVRGLASPGGIGDPVI